MYIDVNAAVIVPVNKMPLIDDTDFKTREIAIVYNQAGMDLVWNFQTTSGIVTQTTVTPTTSGDYDWTNLGDGIYTIEIPASGGASINNDAEGFGWFSGICTGVLPWAGPKIGFRSVDLNNSLIDAGESLATANQLAGLANVGSAINRPAASYTLTTGTQSANTFAATEALDGVNHEHEDDSGVLDLYYEFNIGAGFASAVHVTGYVNGNNDDVDVYGYDWIATAWVQIGNIDGKAQSTNDVNSFDMFVDMVGSGTNQGIVRVRFYKASGLTNATLAIDQIFTSFNQTAEGYQNAAIWLDSNASNTNTVKGIDGTATNPVSTMGAVNTLLSSTNLKSIEVISGSTVTLSVAQNNQVFSGENWTLELAGQDISGSSFIGAHVSGIAAGTGTEQTFRSCHLDAVTHIKETHILECGISGTQTASEAGDYFFDRCHSAIAGTTTWIFDFGAAVGNTNLNLRNYSGGIQLENMGDTGTDTASIEGRGQVIEGTCTSGSVAIRGLFTTSGITNLTLVDDARYARSAQVDATWNALLTSSTYNINKSAGKRLRELLEVAGYEGGFIYYDSTGGGSAGDEPFQNGILENPVDNMTDLNTLLAALPFCCIKISSGSTMTFAASQEKQVFTGEIWTLELGGQSVSGSTFHGAFVDGICTGAIKPNFEDCTINNVTLPPCHMHGCGLAGTLTAGSTGDFFLADDCHSEVAGTGTPYLDFGAAIGDVNLNLRNYSGGIELLNMGQVGTDNISIEGNGQVVINANSIGGTIAIRGHQTLTGDGAFIAAGGVLSDAARFATDQLPSILQTTTIATLTSQTEFTLSSGSSDDNAYNNALIIITDAVTKEQKAIGTIASYVGATKRVLLASNPAIFTMTVGDKVGIISNVSATAGIGSRTVTIEVTDSTSSLPIPDTFVKVMNSTNSVTLAKGYTDGDGRFVCALDDGNYNAVLRKAFTTFVTPIPFTVTGSGTYDFTGSNFSPSAPGSPDTCILYGYVSDLSGNFVEGAEVTAVETLAGRWSPTSKIVDTTLETTTDSSGYFELELIRSSQLTNPEVKYKVTITHPGLEYEAFILIPDAASVDLRTLI